MWEVCRTPSGFCTHTLYRLNRRPPVGKLTVPRIGSLRGPVFSEGLPQNVRDLAHGGEVRQSLPRRVQQVVGALGGVSQVGEGTLHGRVVPALPEGYKPLGLALTDRLVHVVQLHVGLILGSTRVAGHADDDSLPPLHLALVAE